MFRPMGLSMVFLVGVSFGGCGVAVTQSSGGVDEASSRGGPLPSTTRIYFGQTLDATLSSATSRYAYFKFGVQAGSLVKIRNHRSDNVGGLGMKLYAVSASGKTWRLIGQAGSTEPDDTFLEQTIAHRGDYVIEAVASDDNVTVEVTLGCQSPTGNGACELGAGPGEACFAALPIKCDVGLACVPNPGQCISPDGIGSCTQLPVACPRFCGIVPVCGCDGKEYCNDCDVLLAGTSIDHEGPCAPPPAKKGEHCGGFIMNAPECEAPLVCHLNPQLPDTGGVCVDCNVDSDCQAPLPQLCEICSDGNQHCAHSVCLNQTCTPQVCP